MKEELSFDDIKQIIDLIREMENVTAFSLKVGDVEIALSRAADGQLIPTGGGGGASGSVAPAPAPAPAAKPEPAPAQAATAPQAMPPQPAQAATAGEGEVAIKSPMVGTFYRCPKPGDPPFVKEGDAVSEESVLCIIEVMKLMNSLEAKVKGTVVRILVEDAQPVEHGQPLMIIKVDG